MSALDDALYYGRQCIGASYGWWGGGALEYWAPMFTYAPGLTASDVLNSSVNCAGIINVAANMGTGNPDQPYGTMAWADYMREDFDASRWYKVGTILLEPFGGGSEGHVVIVSTPSGQYCLQSNTVWGVTESVTVSYQHVYTPFYYAGWHPTLPNSSQFPGGAKGEALSVAGYPGNYSTPREWAHWAGRVASEIYGIPPTLPVLVMCEEWYGGGSGPMALDADTPNDISSYPGYLYAVDYDSTGWFQQRAMYYGDATNAEHALAMFLDGALDVAPSMPYPTDRDSIAEWAYNTQRSGDPEWFASHWDRVLELLDGYEPPAPGPGPIPKPEELVFEKYNFAAPEKEGSERAFAFAAGAALNSHGIKNLVLVGEKNIQLARDAKANLYEMSGEDDVQILRWWRTYIIPPIAKAEGLEGLLTRFDDILAATDPSVYEAMLYEARKPGPMPDPPPEPPPPEHYSERGWIQTNYSDEKRLRFKPEGSSYPDPWFELVELDELENEDLVLRLRRQ